jgi:hypothetical protein
VVREVLKSIQRNDGQIELDDNDQDQQRLMPDDKISEIWPEPPSGAHLHVYVTIHVGAGSECFIHLFALTQDF